MSQKTAIVFALKAFWFWLVSILLGPFALWVLLEGKMRRRGLVKGGFSRMFLFAGGFLAFSVFLFLAPAHWALLLGLYAASAVWTASALSRSPRSGFFDPPGGKGRPEDRGSLGQAALASALAIYPLVYILALLDNIGELEHFSIRLPSDVYTDGLLWMALATPLVALAAWIAWRASYNPGLRALIFLYGAVLVVLAWIMVWERLDEHVLSLIYDYDREPLLFGYRSEAVFRSAVHFLFYGGAFLLGIGYLVGAARTSVFAKRALFLGLPSLVLYANMLFVLGDWNYYLSALRNGLFQSRHHGIYRLAAHAQLSRTPAAFRSPYVLDEWMELEYQSGHPEKARTMLEELVSLCDNHPYYARLGRRARAQLRKWDLYGSHAGAAPDGGTLLDLPIIKPASYLDQEWYALLSAVAFLRPEWTDLEMRKRLLELSNTVQLHLPKLANVPELVPALRQLGIQSTACFLDTDRMKAALAKRHIPFLSLFGRWVPVSGYDPVRDGFYYFAYPESEDRPEWFRNEDTDLFYHHPGEAFGGERELNRSKAFKYSVQKFIPAEDLSAHLLDIGGVGLVLGDSAFVEVKERKAAYLVEQGDVFYQDHDNYEEAAAAYAQAASLYASDHILSRSFYLKRRYEGNAGDDRDYRNLFRTYPPEWMEHLALDPVKEKALKQKMMDGKLGTYLMVNWYTSPLPDISPESGAAMDTAVKLFTRLHEMDPAEPLYLDSLATLSSRRGDLSAAERELNDLIKLYPFGNDYAIFRLAWTKMKMGKLEDLEDLLPLCGEFSQEAKFLTMKAALAMRKGQYRRAYRALSRSLKLDKAVGETHTLLADYFRRRGDKSAERVHLQWLRRNT